MARVSLLDARTAHFLDLVGNGRLYRVPPYQRDYSWDEEQWDDLWSDLCDLRRQPEDRHYMGALTREVAKHAPDEWTPLHLDARQKRLAQRALHVWRIDFA